MRTSIDLNCDLGEGMGADEALLDIVSSANIACGYHAGDPATMQRTVASAVRRGVAIGAHPGYKDREGFGRRPMTLDEIELTRLLLDQIEALAAVAEQHGATLSHVRAHGALGNLADSHHPTAAILARIVSEFHHRPALMTLSDSAAAHAAASHGLAVVRQFFADRAYDDSGQLVSRREPGAVLHDPDVIVRRVLDFLETGAVRTHGGGTIAVSADTICLHGDTPAALAVSERLRSELEANGIVIKPFHRSSDQTSHSSTPKGARP